MGPVLARGGNWTEYMPLCQTQCLFFPEITIIRENIFPCPLGPVIVRGAAILYSTDFC